MGVKKKVLDKGLAISPGFVRAEPPEVIRPETSKLKALRAYRTQSKLFSPMAPSEPKKSFLTDSGPEESLSLEEILDSKPKAA